MNEPVHNAPRRVRVAMVAASLRILGGQAVQAQRNISGFRGDPAIDTWLVPINPLPPRPLDRLLAVGGVRTLITQLFYWPLLVRELRRADVVHVFSASYLSFMLAPLPAILVAKALRRPVLLNYHSGEAPDHLRRSWLARFILRHVVDLNVVPSRFLQQVFASFGIPATVVSNSVDLDRFAYRTRDPLRPRLLSTRNFERHYNVGCTLRAFARVQQLYPDATLTLVGGGSEDPALRELAAALQLRNVRFAGRVPPDQIHRYYADADIYVQTPSIDNMPLSLLEAFATGLPVVSTDVGGVPAMLTDGVHGYLTPDNDDAAVARCIESILTAPDEARRRAAAARAACDAYAWSVVRAQWVAAYQQLVPGRSGGVAAPDGGLGRRQAPAPGGPP